jgi:PAS domain S-box-containing protein
MMEQTMTDVLSGGGELGALMRGRDWAHTPLGPIERWPNSLKTAVRIMLTSRQPIWLGWGEELIKLYNEPYRAIVGGKHPAALGQPASIVWREIWDAIGPMLQQAMGSGEGTYVEAQLLIMERNGYPEETYYTFSYSPIPNDEGGVGGIICANTDDTERVIGERQLALLRELAARTADARTFDAACTLSGLCLETNLHDLPFALIYLAEPDARRAVLSGTSGIERGHAAAPEVVELDADAIWPIGEVLRTHQPRLIADVRALGLGLPTGAWPRPPHQAVAVPIAPSGPTGKAGVLVVGLNPFRLFDDRYQGFINLVAGQIGASIANAQAYEAERLRAARLAEIDRAKTAFFANISHEFRTPLTLMLGPLEDLQRMRGTLVAEERDQLDVAHRNALRLLRLVNTLLDFSRIEAGRLEAVYEPTDLASYTTDLASIFRSAIERASLSLVVDCPPLPAPVYVDRELWERIVLNLLSNALKFTFVGEIAVSLRAAGPQAELIIRDTGTGIAPEEIPHLFERFYRAKHAHGRTFEGSGIGLTLVHELVQLHGGVVRVESEVDRGSAFIVTIPFGSAHLPAERVGVPRTSAQGHGESYVAEALRWLPDQGAPDHDQPREMVLLAEAAPPAERDRPRILLADDNADMRAYLRRLLSRWYDITTVDDGLAALAAARAAPFELVLTDVMMPRLDGFGLLAALRADERTKELPVILLSARAGEESRIEGMEAGADDYLVKPFSARELLARVETRLEIARLRRDAVERERALRAEAQAARDAMEHVLNQLNDHYVAYDQNWRYVFVNTQAEEVLGLSKEQLIGQRIWDLFPDAVGNDYYEAVHRALAEQRDLVFEYYYAPFARWFENHIYAAPEGVAVLSTDITARKRAEEALRESDARMELAIRANRMVTWEWDVHANRITTSASFADVYGLPALADAAEGFALVFPADKETHLAHVQRIATHGGDYMSEFRIIRPDNGQVVWLEERATAFRGGQGHPERLVGVTLDVTARKQAEEQLHAALEGAQLGAWSWDPTTNRSLPDQRTLALFGIDPMSFTGDAAAIFARIHPDDLPSVADALQAAQQPGGEYRAEFRVLPPDGVLRWLAGVGRGRFDPAGRVQQVYGVNFDITARKQAEADTRFLDELGDYIRASDTAGALLADVVRMTGAHLQLSRCFFAEVDNPADRWTVYYDYRMPADQASITGEHPISAYPPDLVAVLRAGQCAAVQDTASDPLTAAYHSAGFQPLGARAFVCVPLLREGGWLLALAGFADAPRDWQPREVRLLQTVADRTWNAVEKLRLEAAQRDYAVRIQQLNAASLAINAAPTRAELLHQITDEARALIGADLAIVHLVRDGNWQESQVVVSQVERYDSWQTSSAQLASQQIYRLVSEERRALRLTQAELGEHPVWRGLGADADRHPPLDGLLATPLLDRNGVCIGVIQLLDKATDTFTAADEGLLQQLAQMAAIALENQMLYEQEQVARQAAEEASRLKDEFLATVSHELRTPLTALLGYAQLLQSRKRDEAYVARAIEKIVASAKAQAQITEDLLDVARIVTGKLQIESRPIDLSVVVRAALDAVRPAVEAKGLRLQLDLDRGGCVIVGDVNRLQQVIWNLLSNATKFTGPGGTIAIQLEPDGSDVRLVVTDTGQGINAAFLPFVFDRFRQADSTSNRAYGGLGLGLAIVRHLVELHGGTVHVASAGVGHGATFTVRLPRVVISSMAAPSPAEPATDDATSGCLPELAGLRVLVVDDQPDILELLFEILAPCGAVVQLCATAREALDAVRIWRPDVLVSDIAMPGEDGYTLIRAIRALPPEEGGALPAAALTAYVRIEDRMRVLSEGFQIYVPKPVDPRDLRRAVAQIAQQAASD